MTNILDKKENVYIKGSLDGRLDVLSSLLKFSENDSSFFQNKKRFMLDFFKKEIKKIEEDRKNWTKNMAIEDLENE